jgi:hypothetical protein
MGNEGECERGRREMADGTARKRHGAKRMRGNGVRGIKGMET